MIECTLAEIKRLSFPPNIDNRVKHGMYSSSIYHNVKGFGKKAWVVIVNIDLDYERYVSEGKSLEEIARGCVEYLNTPLKSKYGKKRKRKLPYGEFREEPYRANLREKDGKKFIQALLVVNNRSRRCFWGSGEKMRLSRK